MSDIFFKQSPTLWSVETLVSHGHQVVTDLARDAATSTTAMRYLLGRCMLAMDRLGTYKEMGLSSSVHFATQHLKMNERLAKLILSVAQQLQELPLLSQAVLHGELEWSQIREVVTVATPDTEEMWKELCLKNNCTQIQSLVSATPKGGIPGEIASKLPRKTSEYRCRFQPEVVVLIERCLQKMSRKLNKPVLFREAVERFVTEFLADKPYDEAAEKMLEEARKDFLAGRILQEPLIQNAREVARDVGLLGDLEDDARESDDGPGSEMTSGPVKLLDGVQASERVEAGALNGTARSSQATGPHASEVSRHPESDEALQDCASVGNQAFQAIEGLQQAVGGELPWELLDESRPVESDFTHVCNGSPELDKQLPIVTTDAPTVESSVINPEARALETLRRWGASVGSGVTSEDQLSHVGKNNAESITPPDSSGCCNSPNSGRHDSPEASAKRPTSKVTPLRTPFSNQRTRPGFEPKAPTLLKNLMSQLKFNADARFPSKAQRRALLRRDRYCCRTPGCANHLFLEIHHVVRYCEGGKTLPRFLLTLCSRCHKHTEEGKLNIRLTETGELVFTDQYGKNLEEVRRLERALWLDYWLGWKGKETDSHWARAVGFSESAA